MERQAEYVLRTVEERGIRFIRLWFTDVQGFLKSVAINPAELEVAFSEGMTFDGSAIDGYARVQEADMIAKPDPSTFQIIPWRPEQQVARMFCDILTPSGEPFDGDPRWVLKRNLRRAADLGFTFFVGPELEWFYFKDSGPNPQVLDRGGYFDLTPLDVAQEYRRTTINALEQLGIPVESSHHEVAPSQHEIDLRYTDALTMADNVMTYRLAVKEVAIEHGIYATFMPKPLANHDGNGMHVHLSLFEGDRNAFYEAGSDLGLSKVAQSFIAGLIKHGPEITGVTNQWVNSYKRLVSGFDAPLYLTWARNNQSALVRVPSVKAGKQASTRVEYRAPDAACNPYMAFSVLLAAGLTGIENAYELSPEMPRNVYDLTKAERAAADIGTLPSNLSEALDLMEDSELVAEALGEHMFGWFLKNKRKEWDRYQRHVSQFELEEYLPIL
ncbi:MAG: glutamine synthetase [Actinobacteria bacterium]|nr:glutamine synthetase [Actinomycetota bacterium]